MGSPSSINPTLAHNVEVSIPRTFISEPISSRKEDPAEIVVKGKDHQEDDENESDLLGDFHLLYTDGSSQNCFHHKKEDMSSVENRDREKIDEPKIDTQNGDEA